MIKPLIVFMLLAIIGSLFSGLFFLYRDRGAGTRMARALTIRMALSVILFMVLMLAFHFGAISAQRQ
jgi:hypothetical protein